MQKHLWKLPIPEFDAGNPLHVTVSEAGRVATEGALKQLERLRQERDRVTVTIARRELRRWLRESSEGQAVEDVVSALLYMQVIQTEIVSAAYAIGGRSAAHV